MTPCGSCFQRWDEDNGNKIWQDHVWVDHHGWPSIRHYNKKVGRLGRAYVKKSGNGDDSQRSCTELGEEMAMLRDYIEEAGNTLLCKPDQPDKVPLSAPIDPDLVDWLCTTGMYSKGRPVHKKDEGVEQTAD